MKVTELSVWEQLGSLQQGWSELAANCDASPFAWPSFPIPWWYEMGRGRLMSVAVEESGILVGLAVIHDRVGDIGRHLLRFLGDGIGGYNQLLVADGRDDVSAVLWERLLSFGWAFDLTSVPTEIAQGYDAVATSSLALNEQKDAAFLTVPVDCREIARPGDDCRSVRTVTSPGECLDVLTGTPAAAAWGGGVPGSPMAAFFASAVDASVRAGRMTLHVKQNHDGPISGVLVAHGAGTSAVWRNVWEPGSGADAALVHVATAEAAARGSRRVLWPHSSGVSGKPFPLSDVTRAGGGRLRELPELARGVIRGFKEYGSG